MGTHKHLLLKSNLFELFALTGSGDAKTFFSYQLLPYYSPLPFHLLMLTFTLVFRGGQDTETMPLNVSSCSWRIEDDGSVQYCVQYSSLLVPLHPCTLGPLHSCILLLSYPCTMLLSKPFALTCTCSHNLHLLPPDHVLFISSSWLTFDCTFVPVHACLNLPTPFMLHYSCSCLFVPLLAFLYSLFLHSPVYPFMFPCTCSHPLCPFVPVHNLHACLCLHIPLTPLCW